MNRTLLCLLALVAFLPSAHALGVDDASTELRCTFNPGYVANMAICPTGECRSDGHCAGTCSGTQVFILTDNQCRADKGTGCEGQQVFIASSNNCHGGKGAAGCDGISVFSPASDNNCQGGGGKLSQLFLLPA